jgi:hypothetical protein
MADEPEKKWPLALWIGISLTGAWVLFATIYTFNNAEKIWKLDPNTLGDWLAGFSAPLAFLWLIVATFLQKEELASQRKELSLSRQALEQQARELNASVEQFRLQSELAKQENVRRTTQEAVSTVDQQGDLLIGEFVSMIRIMSRIYTWLAPNGAQVQANMLDMAHFREMKQNGDRWAPYREFVTTINSTQKLYYPSRPDFYTRWAEHLPNDESSMMILRSVIARIARIQELTRVNGLHAYEERLEYECVFATKEILDNLISKLEERA